jgi:exopolysaccharide biosynthesis protein
MSTVYLFSVDGRQPGFSAGMTLVEMADFMIGLGAYQALNLDGGGSTTIVVANRVVNRPADAAGERRVSNALMIISTLPLEP